MEHGILRDAFVQDADLVDAVHDPPQLRNRRPRKSVRFVEGFEPLLNFQRLDVLRDLLTEPLDEVIADIMLNDGDGVGRFRAHSIAPEIGLQIMLRKKICLTSAEMGVS